MGINSKRVVAQWPKTVNLCDDYLNFLFFDFMILNLYFAVILFSKEAFLWLKDDWNYLLVFQAIEVLKKVGYATHFFVKIFPLAGVSINHTHTGWDVTSQEVILVVFWQLSE